jgi:protein ImuB
MASRTLVVVVPDWSAVAAGAAPEVAIAVLRANRVVAVTPAARAEGVTVGLRRREAQGRCPELVIVHADAARDTRAFEPVAAALAAAVTPRLEVVAPGRLALSTRGPARYFGGDALLADLVVDVAGAALVACRLPPAPVLVGIADGPFAALLAAERSGSEGAVIIAAGGSPAFLAPFPVDVLDRAGLPEALLDVARRLGLRTLGALAALPAGAVVARFGPDGAVAHRLAAGLDERPPATTAPPPDLAVRVELDPPAERVETAAFAARGLADELGRRLDALGLACACVAVVAETDHGERLERRWRADGAGGRAALTPGAIADRVRWQLDGWLTSSHRHPGGPPRAGIVALALVPDAVVPADGRQLGFWGGAAAADERAVRALARLAGLLGPGAVGVPEHRGGRSPAEAVAVVPAAGILFDDTGGGPRTREAATARAPWPGRLPVPLPAAVAADPAPAEVVDATGATVGVTSRGLITASPAAVRAGGERAPWSDVRAWAGPWPAEERWWDPLRHRRRARLQVLDADGVARLLTLEAGHWWVEATYD